MSGFLPDIASWALGGGAGQGESAANNENGEQNNDGNNETAISEEEMRAKRMARLAALEKKQSSDATAEGSNNEGGDSGGDARSSSMDEDNKPPSPTGGDDAQAQPMEVDEIKPAAASSPKDVTMEPAPKKKIKAPPSKPAPGASAADPLAKLRRKKTLLLRRVLLVTFGDAASDRAHSCVHLALDDDEIYDSAKSPRGVQIRHIAELLAARLSLSPSSRSLETVPPQPNKAAGLIGYLGGCHKRAGEELKQLRAQASQKSKKKNDDSVDQFCGILEEIRSQVVSYAASSLMVPDLFELGNDAPLQLAKCLSTTSTDPTSSITFDVLGKNSSFYHCVCEELHSQDAESFTTVVGDVVKHMTDSLSKVASLLDEGSSEGVGGNGLFLASALRELCTNKKATISLAKMPSFLVPPANTPQAAVRVQPPLPQVPAGASQQQMALIRMMQSMRDQASAPYLRRSGPGLEKDTVLGLVLRLGVPAEHGSVASSFSNPATRTRKDVSQITEGFRRQLELYQIKCNELVKAMVVAGAESRNRVIQWFTDALLLNVNADGTRPDRSKVSSEELLVNISVVMLKLCEPFINDPKKALLVDPGFVSSPESHGGVYVTTGDNALPRLGQNISNAESLPPYHPKNSFIPLCFFFCSRSLSLTVVPGGGRYENIARNVYHAHRTIRQQNGDLRSDPRFNRLLQIQYAKEIVMMSPTYITDVFRYYNMAAGIFLAMEKERLKTMPEHIVDDLCSVLVYASSFCSKLLGGVDFGNLFRLTVQLLSKNYAQLVRNYNLRAKLGDVLHDIFLPGNSDSHSEVPDSVTCDPLAGGQPYLTSDKMSKETLAPSLLLLYGEVENTGFYEKNDHRTKIAALLKFLWDSPEHKPAFKRITEDTKSFITFANGIINEMNDKFANVMETLPAIRTVQLQMANPQEWGALSEEERETITSRHENNEREVQRSLPLCNSVMKMLGFLNTDKDIRDMFLLPDMCPRLANMLLHVLTKLVGSRGLGLKVENPESYNFRPKEMLQDLCVVFSSFAAADEFQIECAKSGYYTPDLMNKSVKTCRKLGLLVGESMELFALLATKVEDASKLMTGDDDLYQNAPDEFLDPLMQEFMSDPVKLPTSGNIVDRKTITQHLLNDDTDPFNRKKLSIDDVVPAEELKAKMKLWLDDAKAKRAIKDS
mmetsp:Transcript_56544/g.120095  ORF Transcript_56544/g.120095 Transcript_56544/m.120095 type:complete len:1170 (+) Transcript_56544:81-3590(+)|eukprot:CAMPEP_0172531964 /NCGR_PEP_ID=MMETSP1067-20121228/5173_1 /TAXON_ID=265564 ORGANISM="Thalassiosira punctigera, Strain Tpunct2005C2" /NCGR_SAMPLE_ID=MMETSP1067 /ASSEMBLY_ACC=CAM_ASM_000444 /LENGTH=1169 /DNA_ID=CAMNT_0013316411 /DNA_START=50 /DNA_END=3559 /DNA_ORIENTATION=+